MNSSPGGRIAMRRKIYIFSCSRKSNQRFAAYHTVIPYCVFALQMSQSDKASIKATESPAKRSPAKGGAGEKFYDFTNLRIYDFMNFLFLRLVTFSEDQYINIQFGAGVPAAASSPSLRRKNTSRRCLAKNNRFARKKHLPLAVKAANSFMIL